jgi:XRE family aerobic/anaerobic benzoate catabolism transcriptional regulator
MTTPADAPPPTTDDDAGFLLGLGERLRLIRARRGMSRRILSHQAAVSERYIAQMEAGDGNVSILKLRAIARALGVTITELLGERAEHAADAMLIAGLLSRLSEAELQEARELLQTRFAAAGPRHGRVALIGLRGAGKSTLGRMLAVHRSVGFIELDREVEREAGMDISAVFELHGQPGFRRLERRVLERLVTDPSAAVLAAGGSIVADPATFALLLGNWRTVWVRATPEEHMQRVIDQGDLRPMHDNRQAMDDLRAILASREQLYAKADLVLDTSGRTPAQSFQALLTLLDP